MKTLSIWKLRSRLFAGILVATSLSPASRAQDLGMSVEVNVPFAFENGTQHFAPGLYMIRMEEQHLLLIQGRSQSGLTLTWFDERPQALEDDQGRVPEIRRSVLSE
jgi:hypothetical protein